MKSVFGLLCLSMAMAACDKDAPSAPDMPPAGNVEQITGSERIGWQQQASSAAELSTFRYNIYVDNAANEIQEVSCAAAGGAFACSGKLPSMSAGRHVLEISTFVDSGTRAEKLAIDGVDRERRPVADGGRQHRTDHDRHGGRHPSRRGVADGGPRGPDRLRGCRRRSHLHRRARGTDSSIPGRPTAARRRSRSTTSWPPNAAACSRSHSIPISRRTGHVFAAYTADSGFRLVRYRASGDTLGESATLLDGVDVDAGHSVGDASIRARRQAVSRSRRLRRSVAARAIWDRSTARSFA